MWTRDDFLGGQHVIVHCSETLNAPWASVYGSNRILGGLERMLLWESTIRAELLFVVWVLISWPLSAWFLRGRQKHTSVWRDGGKGDLAADSRPQVWSLMSHTVTRGWTQKTESVLHQGPSRSTNFPPIKLWNSWSHWFCCPVRLYPPFLCKLNF